MTAPESPDDRLRRLEGLEAWALDLAERIDAALADDPSSRLHRGTAAPTLADCPRSVLVRLRREIGWWTRPPSAS